MVDGYYTTVVRELKQSGYRYNANAKGSHEKWVGPSGKVLIVQRNMKSRHTANGILKTAGSSVRV